MDKKSEVTFPSPQQQSEKKMNSGTIFFTEDGQPVRTVYVGGLRASENEHKLRKFFNVNVGNVSNVRIHSSNRQNRKISFGFVEFTDPNHAGRAIVTNKFLINNHKIFVQKADDWHQPVELTTTEPIIQEDDLITIKNTPLIRLNDDCLLEIYKYLHPFDVVNLSISFSRLNDFAQNYIYQKYATFDFDTQFGLLNYNDQFNLTNYGKLMSHIGPYINDFTISTVLDDKERHLLQIMLRYCTSLESLRLNGLGNSIENVNIPPKLTTSIKSLQLVDCSQLSDKFVRFIKICPQLEKLIICSNSAITGTFLRYTNNLVELHLVSVYGIKNINLNNIFETNKKLRTLTINNCGSLSGTIYSDLVERLPQLQHLCIDLKNVSGPNQLNCLSNLEHLRHLQIYCNLYNISTYLKKLGDRNRLEIFEINSGLIETETLDTLFKFNRLKKLRISNPFAEHENMLEMISKHLPQLDEFHCCGCNSITDTTLIEYVKTTPQLKRLIATNCYGINIPVLIDGLIQMLKKLTINENSMNEKRSALKLILDCDDFEPETTALLEKNSNLLVVSKYKPVSQEFLYDDYIQDEIDFDDFEYFDPEGYDSDYLYNEYDSDTDDFDLDLDFD